MALLLLMMLQRLISLMNIFVMFLPHRMLLLYSVFSGVPLTNCNISVEGVFEKLIILQVSKSAGPDDSHARILKETASQIALLLTIIFYHQENCQKIGKRLILFLFLRVVVEISHPTTVQSVLPLLLSSY